jgi:hypothetical protein
MDRRCIFIFASAFALPLPLHVPLSLPVSLPAPVPLSVPFPFPFPLPFAFVGTYLFCIMFVVLLPVVGADVLQMQRVQHHAVDGQICDDQWRPILQTSFQAVRNSIEM